MGDQIQYAVHMKIHDGKLGEFKALAREATDTVEANEPDMQGYNWYMDADETNATLFEQYPSSDHILKHLENVGPILQKLLGVVDLNIDVYGKIGSDARAALDPLGAVYHDQVVGFSRF